jgi:hypothetical protein
MDRRDLPASPTQFAWRAAACGAFPPPEPRRGNRYGPPGPCWLCAGDTGGVGWPRSVAIAPTFCDHNEAAAPSSASVCQACVALSRSEGWAQYARVHPERGFEEYFPAKPGKKPRAWNWLYRSHLFAEPGHHECPDRVRWREILLDPPRPPFLAVIAASGQKHGIFRARIAHDRERFAVQADDRRLWLDREQFGFCLGVFESLYQMGFSRDSILAGDYHQGQIMKVGIRRFLDAENAMRPWRCRWPDLTWLSWYVCRRADAPLAESAPRLSRIESTAPKPDNPAEPQLRLF